MSKNLFLIVFFTILSFGLYSQRITIELNFNAENNGTSVQLDSIKVINRSSSVENMIYWPDNSISLDIVPGDLLLFIGYATFSGFGISEINKKGEYFQLFQNYPNPSKSRSLVCMTVPEDGSIRVVITDLQGRIVIENERCLEKGCHSFLFTPGDCHIYLLSATYRGNTQSIKVVSLESEIVKKCSLDYNGCVENLPQAQLKSMQTEIVKQSGILASPLSDSEYHFQFATNISCPGIPTVNYEGQVYNTIQIFSQCWLKENLNVGTMIPVSQNQSNNGTIEKYCYNSDINNCNTYGGLYQWDEMMQYIEQQGSQGICPQGWHLPTDEEWMVLEGAVDTQNGIGDNTWDDLDFRGTDAGTNLKSTSGWYGNGNGADKHGFSGLSGGGLYGDSFQFVGDYGNWWSSTEGGYGAMWRVLTSDSPGVYRRGKEKEHGFSVRCLRDY